MAFLWNKENIPQRGWVCIDVEDLEDTIHTCEMCGNENVRYVHWMHHPEHVPDLRVGCVCAEKMADGYEGVSRERRLKNRAARRAKWVKRYWPQRLISDRPIVVGMQLKTQGYKFCIVPVTGGWRGSITLPTGRVIQGRRTFNDLNTLKLILFDYVWPRRLGPTTHQ
ncbi:hypothetical protein [Polyangium jinanense]|uniref:Uncharacterized protein n=1 Tax=Polyangium jinanense TaxID=2829994 RepID=A0A9X3X4C9_9BACT|nr:hypothetical protein [Polyangium jinanense]MDC3959038.1 hypothetical protein [Polyangium jinanense]MDC3984039.1 hypothetical protein [Polyangium jinanense]